MAPQQPFAAWLFARLRTPQRAFRLLENIEALAELYASNGHLEQALPCSQEVLASYRHLYGNQDLRTLHTMTKVGQMLLTLGHTTEGGQLVLCMENIHGKDHPDVHNLKGLLYDLISSAEAELASCKTASTA